jgi:preprotein translocase subunit SecB
LLTFKTLLPIDEKSKCEIELSIEGVFHTLTELDEIQSEVIENFISKDAIVLFWPYLRQYLHDITEKMRLGMRPLPIIDPRALVERSTKK